MRLLELPTNFRPGGIQRHVLDLTAHLRTKGHQVTLAGDGGAWAQVGRDPDHLHLGLNDVAELGGALPRRLAHLPLRVWQLRRVLKSRRIELIHAHETAPTLVADLARRGLGIPLVMTFHGCAPEREASVATMGKRADLVISPSRAGIEALVQHGMPATKGRVLGLGIATTAAPPPDEALALRHQILAGRKGPLILSLSRLQVQKGIDVMVEVAARVQARHPGVVFAVAGGGPQEVQVRAWAEAAGVAGAMRFLGPISTVPLHLAAADLFLLTSRWENLPISIVEAFRAGLPVVATDCGGVRELVDDAVGSLCRVEDAAGIARAIDRLIEDPTLRQAKGAVARARSAEARFDPDAVHGQFEAAYRDLLNRKG